MSNELLPFVEVNHGNHINALVMWLHGLGDSGNGFAPIVPELRLPESLGVRFVFPHAPVRPVTINGGMPMRAWYDINSMDFNHRADAQGVHQSADAVKALLLQQMQQFNIAAERVVLAGFSQGGVIALHLGPRFEQGLAGIMALSTYMSESEKLTSDKHSANQHTPILQMHGQQDEVVPMFMGHAAYKVLQDNGYQTEWKDYPMQHNVCPTQLADIRQWLVDRLR